MVKSLSHAARNPHPQPLPLRFTSTVRYLHGLADPLRQGFPVLLSYLTVMYPGVMTVLPQSIPPPPPPPDPLHLPHPPDPARGQQQLHIKRVKEYNVKCILQSQWSNDCIRQATMTAPRSPPPTHTHPQTHTPTNPHTCYIFVTLPHAFHPFFEDATHTAAVNPETSNPFFLYERAPTPLSKNLIPFLYDAPKAHRRFVPPSHPPPAVSRIYPHIPLYTPIPANLRTHR